MPCLPTIFPAADVTHPWYGPRRRRSLISTSEDIQAFQHRRVGSTLRTSAQVWSRGSLPSRCGSSSCRASLQSHPCHFTDSTLEHHARTIVFLLAKPQGAQLTPRSPWRLAQRNAINNTSSAVPTQSSVTKECFCALQAVEARQKSHAEFRCLVLRCGGLRTRAPDQR